MQVIFKKSEKAGGGYTSFILPFTVAKRVFLHGRTWRPLWRRESVINEV